ncbi:MAG: hypothetical protein ABIU11_00940, partial [Chitinophagaceae bacterium]
LLGGRTDAIMTTRQVMFLPDYLMKTFDNTRIGTRPLVISSKNLYPVLPQNNNTNFITHPAFVFSVFLLLIVLLSFSKKPSIQRFIYGFDGFIFFVTGLLGILILFMWFGTDHTMCKDNYNLIWALPMHAVAAFYIHSRKPKAVIYFRIATIVTCAILFTWFLLPQHMNTSLIPFILLLIFRSAVAGYKMK